MATSLMDFDPTEGSVKVDCQTNEWGELESNIFIFANGRKYHFVGCNSEQKVYVTALSSDNSFWLYSRALYKMGEEGYEFVLLPKGYSEKEIVSACTEFVGRDLLN